MQINTYLVELTYVLILNDLITWCDFGLKACFDESIIDYVKLKSLFYILFLNLFEKDTII